MNYTPNETGPDRDYVAVPPPPMAPIVDYPADADIDAQGHRIVSRGMLALTIALAVALIGSLAALTVQHVNNSKRTSATAISAPFEDYCGNTPESAALRAKLLYTDTRYMRQEPAQTSADTDNPDQKWCVIGTSYESELWWVVAYVGQDNPIYKSMLAENGKADDATRAVITYQGIPPIKFAREGWIGFITPSEDTWSEFKAGAGAMLLFDIAEQATGK